MPTQVRREIGRTRTGCWTCRMRRKKCDETRPQCNTCLNMALQCEGYGVRLKWITHRKSVTMAHGRSRNRGMRLSPATSSSPSPPNSARDGFLLQHLGHTVFDSLSVYERELLHDFSDWGAATLGSSMTADAEDLSEMLSACAISQSWLANCLTYQITLDPKHGQHFEHYYSRSLEQFRTELSNPASMDKEATAYAGLLLCTISMNRAMPWTVHLNGITSILEERGILAIPAAGAKDLITLIGVLDLPTHILGRKSNNLHVWYNHCRGQSGLEPVTGLPCSLLDLLSSVMEPDIEKRLLLWPGEPGEPAQCKIWNATRYAGVITARYIQMISDIDTEPIAVAVRNIILAMHELRTDTRNKPSTNRNAFLYPLVAAGSQQSVLTDKDKLFIDSYIVDLANGSLDKDPYYKGVATVLRELWKNNHGRSLQQVTRDLNLELGLF